MSRAIDPAVQGLSEQQIRDFYAFCLYCEQDGNRGYASGFNTQPGRFILDTEYRAFREGIFFYSTGWAYRLRKKPHWRTVFAARFPNTYELILSEQKEIS